MLTLATALTLNPTLMAIPTPPLLGAQGWSTETSSPFGYAASGSPHFRLPSAFRVGGEAAEQRERHLHPELQYAVLRPHYLAYKRAKMNDGSRFVTGKPKTAMERRSLRKQRRYAFSAAERRMGALSQAEMAVVAEEHRRRWPERQDGKPTPSLPPCLPPGRFPHA